MRNETERDMLRDVCHGCSAAAEGDRMAKRKVLYVCHGHPRIRPGGAEAYALELYEAMRQSQRFEPLLLARSGKPISKIGRYHEGTLLTGVNGDPNQYFLYTEYSEFDWFLGTTRNREAITRHFRDFLAAYRPEVIHFQHTLFIGYEAIRVARNLLPESAVIYTLHEFQPICHRQGQMLRVGSEEPCSEESPRRCHECFPDIPPQEFFIRKRFIQEQLSVVDLFLAPSRFLRDRYVDWGLPAEKIVVEDYGRRPVPEPAEPDDRPDRNRIAFFGQLSHYKGINVLLEAMKRLLERGVDVQLAVHGANLELQPQDFLDDFHSLLAATEENVTLAGAYAPEDLPALLARTDFAVVPSIWWENSPLVIQEAFLHRRPVICSDIGGMAEKVTDGIDGLHFRARDPDSLADTIERAVGTPGLWEKLRDGIEGAHAMDEHVERLSGLYEELLERRRDERAQGNVPASGGAASAAGG
jgi:glycosyltransferase involved in cell wall biosynthesis